MAVKELVTKEGKNIDDRKILELIEKGGSVKEDKGKKKKRKVCFVMRVSPDLLDIIDEHVSRRHDMTRMEWVRQAIIEKIEQENAKQ